jgi:hypothetical protein
VEKYQQRKLIELEEAVDRLFHNALGTISVDGAEYSPNTMESRKRGSFALKWVLHRLMEKHPSLWAHLLREKRTVQEAEEAAMARIRKHWEEKGLGLFSRCGMTHRAWQININMTSHRWNTRLQDFERVLLPGGTPMCVHPSLHHILKEREKIAEELGISSKTNEISTSFDVITSLVCRLEYLDNKGLLTGCVDDPGCLLVQLLADASQIFRAKNTNATAMVLKPIYDDSCLTEENIDLVNSRFNLVLVALYRKDDSYENLCSHAGAVAQQIETLRQQGVTVNGKHWRIKMPVGGDMKLLSAMMGLCGCSSEWPCVYCKCSTHDFSKSKEKWLPEGLPLRQLHEHLQMQHIPMGAQYACPSPHCNAQIKPGSVAPDSSLMNDTKRRAEQRKHFGGVPGRAPFTNIPLEDYIMDTLHLILRVVPLLFRQTVQANVNDKTLEKVAQWLYDKCDIIISDKVALQTDTGTKKLSMSAESWPRNVCREVMDWYPEILKMAIPQWEGKDKGLYQRCSDAWTNFAYLAALISDGCEPNVVAWDAHAAELDAAGADVLAAFIAVSTNVAVRSPYLHVLACHLGDMVRRWGPLTQFSSQACEALHQWIKTFAKHSNRRQWVRTAAMSTVVRARVEQVHGPAKRSQSAGRKRAATGHMNKVKKAKHSEAKSIAVSLKKEMS